MFGYGYPDRLGHLQTDLPQVITLGTEVRLTKLERRDICSIVADQGKPGNVWLLLIYFISKLYLSLLLEPAFIFCASGVC